MDVRGSHVERYKAARVTEKKAPATINRELAALRRAFRLAVKQERLTTMPTIQLLAEHNVREGFITPADFEKLLAALPEHLQDFTRFAFLTGWRKGELQTLALGRRGPRARHRDPPRRAQQERRGPGAPPRG